jgi:hypothetical protein
MIIDTAAGLSPAGTDGGVAGLKRTGAAHQNS